MNERIFLSPPDVGSRERELLLDAFDSNWIAPLGPHVDAFEDEIAKFCSRRFAVATSSATAALHMALRYVGVKENTFVLTSTMTFAATANAIRYLGAEPIFVDSDEETWNMDPNLLECALYDAHSKGQLPSAVLPVDLYGQCSNYPAIRSICRRFEVPMIVDAAESLGAELQGACAGAVGAAAVFSFNGNKIITTSGGGMLVTDDEEFAKKVRYWSTQAKDPGPHYEHSEIGYNYRLSNLLASLGRGQLESLPEKVERRRNINRYYRSMLSGFPGVTFMPEAEGARSTFWLTALTVDPEISRVTRDDVLSALAKANIEGRPVWKPMHEQVLHRDARVYGGAVSERLFQNGLCLPSGSGLTDNQRARVAQVVLSAFR